jgi:hypothetical protein
MRARAARPIPLEAPVITTALSRILSMNSLQAPQFLILADNPEQNARR